MGRIDYPGAKQDIEARFMVSQLPSGEVMSVKKTKSSGVAAYDTAVENAIYKASPLPKRDDGTVARELELVFNLKDVP
jgi:colicin import membrane protein